MSARRFNLPFQLLETFAGSNDIIHHDDILACQITADFKISFNDGIGTVFLQMQAVPFSKISIIIKAVFKLRTPSVNVIGDMPEPDLILPPCTARHEHHDGTFFRFQTINAFSEEIYTVVHTILERQDASGKILL